MKKIKYMLCAIILIATTFGVSGQMTSLQVDSVQHPLPTIAKCYGSYTGFASVNGYVGIFYGISNPDSVSSLAFISLGNGNFVITISSLTPGATYKFLPKETFPNVFDGTSGTFTMPTCSFTPTISGTNSICSGSSTILTSSFGESYQWYKGGVILSGATSQTYSANSSGNYTVKVTISGCSATSSIFTLTVNSLPTASITPASSTICNGSSATLTASGGVSYLWSNSSVLNPITVSPAITTTYAVTVTDANSCTNTATRTVNVNFSPNVIASGSTTICAGNSTTLTGSGASTYLWSDGFAGSPNIVSPAVTTAYTVVGTNSNGCTATSNVVTVTVNSLPVANITPASSTFCSGGWQILVASGGFTYAWSPGAGLNQTTGVSVIASPVITTIYTVTVTDVIGCSKTAVAVVNINQLPSAVVTAPNSFCAGSSITVSAPVGPGYIYSWSNGYNTQSFSEIPAGTTSYTVTVTDLNGCSKIGNKNVISNSLPTATANASAPVCLGVSTTLTATGGTSYLWNTGDVTASFVSTLPAGTTNFIVTVTDVNSCTAVANTNATVYPLPNVVSSNDTAICSGGSIQILAGGAANYTWVPTTGLNDQNIWNPIATPASTTTYTVTGTIGGCSNYATVIVTVNPFPVINVSNDTIICSGSNILLSATGGTAYLWNSGQTGSLINVSPLNTTTYFVTTSIANCSDTGSVTVTVNPLPNVTGTGGATVCSGTNVTLTANGANNYVWNSGQTGSQVSVSPTSTTTYVATGSDGNGCTDTANVTVTVNQNPSVIISHFADSICIAGQDINLTAIPSGGTWSGIGVSVNSNSFSPSVAGAGTQTVTYTYTDATTSCTDSASKTITVVNLPPVDSIVTNGSTVVISLLMSNYPIKMVVIKTGGSQHQYFSSLQNSSQAIFQNVDIKDGDLILIEPVSATLSGCFVYQTYIWVKSIEGEDISVNFYPNPFNDILNVTIPQGKYEVSLIDMLGRNVRSMSVEGDFKIPRDNLVEGLYLLQIISNGKLVFSDKLKVQN